MVAAVFCALCVLAICIAPLVDLPDTNLRSNDLAILLLCSFMAGATLLLTAAFKPAILSTRVGLAHPERKEQYRLLPLDTNSILRY